MRSKFRIAILGLGGVGGYVGGKLAARYSDSGDVEIAFLVRGEHENAIRTNGLRLITSEGERIARPSIVTSRPELLGVVDLMICCVKSYDLEAGIAPLAAGIDASTVVLPLLNGVDAKERINRVLPNREVWDGCIYLISRLVAPGVVNESGNVGLLYFGSDCAAIESLRRVETILKSAGINAHLSENISQRMWEKFFFISPIATLTSYLDLSVGNIRDSQDHMKLLVHLLTELKTVADAMKIALPDNIVETTLDKAAPLPHDATSSMHADFKRGGKTELDSLTDYVVRQGRKLDVPTPYYESMLAALTAKSG
jgi:2-dehydropantoate 2-reductase